MLNQDYTTKLLNLEDVIITNIENISDQLHISIELPRRKHTCPCCGAQTDRVHDYRTQIIKDIPLARDTFLHLRKRRYRCDCGKRFFEKNAFLPRYYRVTSRLVAENEQQNLSVEFRKYFKKSRGLLMKSIEKLTEDEMHRLALMFEIAPRPADAYRLKNDFLAVSRSGSSSMGKRLLIDWLYSVEAMDLPEFHDCTRACHNWFREIIASLDVPWTIGYIEGCNNKTKVLKRVSYGMRNFNNFRKRILFCNS